MAQQAVIRASDVFNQAMPEGKDPITDGDVTATCPTCPEPVLLSNCRVVQAAETTYSCSVCGSTLLVIGPPNPDDEPWPGRGYRLGDFVLRNAVDLNFAGVLLPKSPNALAAKRPKK